MTNSTDLNAQREIIWKMEDELTRQQNDLARDPTAPANQPLAEPVPVDHETERTAFADLLKFINEHAEDDGTEIEVLSLDEFADSFTPPENSSEPDKGDGP